MRFIPSRKIYQKNSYIDWTRFPSEMTQADPSLQQTNKMNEDKIKRLDELARDQ